MLNIFKIIGYAFKAKQGADNPSELVSETSFAFIEGFFIISFIILGISTAGLGFLAFYYGSNIILIFSLLFLLALSFDIWVFIKIKKIFNKISKKVVNYSKEKYHQVVDNNIIDIKHE